MPKNTEYFNINLDCISSFEMPWLKYPGISKPEYSEKSLRELFVDANPDVKIKLKIESGDDGPLVKVVYKGNKLNVPDSLKACFE